MDDLKRFHDYFYYTCLLYTSEPVLGTTTVIESRQV